MKRLIITSLIFFGIFIIAGMLFIYSGLYPVGADTPHYQATYKILEFARERFIGRASKDIIVPSLDNPQLLLSGGADYNDMCSGCHLKPSLDATDLSVGLYPIPPNLSISHSQHTHTEPDKLEFNEQELQRQFWIIKHGIKASGMPAWGETHDDERIWAMVAFLQHLPELSVKQYNIITSRQLQPNN